MADRKPLQQSVHPSRTLGRYELIGEIASGGMGAVVLARLAGAGGFQRLFAIKLLHKQYAADTEFVEMLLDEARIAARIQHPNVVGVQEVSESPEHGYYLVMDYVEGFPLWDVVQHMNLPPPARWRITNRIVYDALNGLEAAHSLCDDDGNPLNVVHRDISPQNILVSVDGISRVTDFGIAKAAARITSTRAGQLKGKLAYMAPEQARGKKIDGRTDLFAMGIVLWETLTLQRLFKRDSEAETYGQVLNGRVPPVRDLIPTFPAAVDQVLLRALERDADRRFQSAREMAQALEQATRAHNLLGDPHEVGNWVRTTFASQLASRRAAIRTAATVTTIPPGQHVASLPGGLAVPQLLQDRSGAIEAPQAPAPTPGSGIQATPMRANAGSNPRMGTGPQRAPSFQSLPAAQPAGGRHASFQNLPGAQQSGRQPSLSNMAVPPVQAQGPARHPSMANMAPPPVAAGRKDEWDNAKDTVVFAGEDQSMDDDGPTMAMQDSDAPAEIQAAIAKAKAAMAASAKQQGPRQNTMPPVNQARAATGGVAPVGSHAQPQGGHALAGSMAPGVAGPHGAMGSGGYPQPNAGNAWSAAGPHAQGMGMPHAQGMGMPHAQGADPNAMHMQGQMPAQHQPQGPMQPGMPQQLAQQPPPPKSSGMRWVLIALILVCVGAGAAALAFGYMRRQAASANAPRPVSAAPATLQAP